MAATSVALMLLSCSQVLRVAAFSLTISPDHVRVPTTGLSSVTIKCKADVPLTGCQFTWIAKDGQEGPILELRRGQHSRTNHAQLSTALTDYSYSGQGLAVGDCGVNLKVTNLKIWMVACRVQARGGGWNYAWMDLFADSWSNPPNTVTPREVIAVPGGVARLAVKSTDPLTECRFWLPSSTSTVTLDLGETSPNLTSRHTYLGTGLQSGECGLALASISEADNGPVVCKIRKTSPNADDYRFIPLIVASPPSAPLLNVIQKGANVTATCVVGRSRPVANITWFLGDRVVRRDSLDDSPGDVKDEWRWPWMWGSVEQRVSLKLEPTNYGKVLECVVSHVALAQPFEAYHTMLLAAKSSTEVQAQEAAEIAMEMAKLNLEGARSSGRAEEARAREVEAKAKAAELEVEAARSIARAEEARAREVEAKAKAAELEVEAANSTAKATHKTAEIAIEAARSSARAEEARAKNEEARTREEEAWASNAEEELQFERERRSRSLQQPPSSQSA